MQHLFFFFFFFNLLASGQGTTRGFAAGCPSEAQPRSGVITCAEKSRSPRNESIIRRALRHPACLVPPHVPPSVNRTPHPPTITHGKLDRDFQARTQGVGARSEPTRSAPAGWSSGGHKQPTKRNRTQPTGLDVKKQAAREPSKGSEHHQQGGDRMRQQKLSTAATAPHVTSPGLAKMAASVCCPSPTKTQPRAHTTHTHTRQKRAAAGAGPRPRANQNSQWET